MQCCRRALLVAGILLPLSSFAAPEKTVSVIGAGATFPYPLYSKWFSEYRKVDPGVEINYQSIGSGGGIRQLLENTIDFGASDAPMKDDQLKNAQTHVYHFPMILGAVAMTYTLPGITEPLKLNPEVISDIFLGKVFYWNDSKIAALNPEAKLPEMPIMVVYRSDGSGTTAVFTDYLSKISPDWKSKVGSGSSVKWPVGIGGKGNEGVTGFVKNSVGALGYVELLYAEKNRLPVALVQNQAGEFIRPEAKSITAAAEGALSTLPADFRVSITNPPGKGAYPISAFTYLLVYAEMPKAKGAKVKDFLRWALTEGQQMAASMYYAPLPESLVRKAKKQIDQVELINPQK